MDFEHTPTPLSAIDHAADRLLGPYWRLLHRFGRIYFEHAQQIPQNSARAQAEA